MVCSLFSIIQHVQTTAYHPEGNGRVEWFHRRLKDSLCARCTGLDWSDHLPWVMLGLRAAARKDTVILPSQAVFGSTVCLSVQLSLESELDLYGFLQKMKATLSGSEIVNSRFNTAANQIPATVLPQPLLEASHVLVRRDGHVPPLVLLYNGPYTVLRRSLRTFTILMGDREEVVYTSHLKPCHTPIVVPVLPQGTVCCPGQLGSRGYLPVVLLTLPAHPEHSHMLVEGCCHMVGCKHYPPAGRVRWAFCTWFLYYYTSNSGGICCTFTSHNGGTCCTSTSHSGGTSLHSAPSPSAGRLAQEACPLLHSTRATPGCCATAAATSSPSNSPSWNRFPWNSYQGFCTPRRGLHIIQPTSLCPLASLSSRPLQFGLHVLKVWGEPCGLWSLPTVLEVYRRCYPMVLLGGIVM